ncbi:MAG: efflux RND transporter periplasmic adaptor subunit [Oxalicibacterium faecigallinarum]|uniref:efflux RND transporter periplasmic adaptor subunit n=1 Tax=Oxalicibacterium faecigallinarum TaxID=573741 RepID=UPI002807B3AC|nr:efflux RND transporter periplasmic adaptor subunit [Oxalicibacterium faecigallinarum]MDQ7968363.1 efflux RND transporter periplasmic adaptor subunit [Oxalicibacterium faecigallinarum]
MQRTSKHILIGIGVLAIGAILYFQFFHKSDAPRRADNVQTIHSAVAEKKSIPLTVQANGYVSSITLVEVRPKVQNIVRTVHVKEGQFVKAGQLLFTLDERNDQSNVARTRAELAASQSDLADAELTLKRNQDLAQQNFVSQAVVDTSRARVESLRNAIKANQAAAQSSEIVLGDNQIKASIDGRLGIINVFPGTLAQPSGDPMVTITQLDPIAVTFALPERELLNVVNTYPNADAPVTVQLPGQPPMQGKLFFIDNMSDSQSGTIRMKARFDNKAQKLWPGGFVNVSMVTRQVDDAVTVPAQAVVTGPTDKFVYVIQEDATVKDVKVTVLAIENGQAVVTGISGGVRVVVEGAQNLRPGSKVKESTAKPAPASAMPADNT